MSTAILFAIKATHRLPSPIFSEQDSYSFHRPEIPKVWSPGRQHLLSGQNSSFSESTPHRPSQKPRHQCANKSTSLQVLLRPEHHALELAFPPGKPGVGDSGGPASSLPVIKWYQVT